MARKGGKDRGLFEYPKGGSDIGMQRIASIRKKLARRVWRGSAICSGKQTSVWSAKTMAKSWKAGDVVCFMLSGEDADDLNRHKFLFRIIPLLEIVGLDEVYENEKLKN